MSRPWSLTQAEAHLATLAERHGVKIHWVSPWKRSEAAYTYRQVFIPRPRTRRLYLVALHEFGHIVSDIARNLWDMDEPDSVLACEGAAWGWAIMHADPELMRGAVLADFSYLSEGFRRHARWLASAPKE